MNFFKNFQILINLSVGLGWMMACSSSQVQPDHPAVDTIPALEEAGVDTLQTPPVEEHQEAANSPQDVPQPTALAPEVQIPSPSMGVMNPEVVSQFPLSSSSNLPVTASLETSSSDGSLEEKEPQGETEIYEVQPNDTLMKIAFEHYGDLRRWRQIQAWNHNKLSDWNHLPAQLKLVLEKSKHPVVISRNGEKYLIVKGDTLRRISHTVYGKPIYWERIWKNNPELITDPNQIYAGFYLYYIPDPQLSQSSLAAVDNKTGDTRGLASVSYSSNSIQEVSQPPASQPVMGPSQK